MSTTRIERAEKVIAATPQQVFDMLADPRQHGLFDGSGSVRGARADAPERLFLGARFGMDMKIGAPYKITNEVVEFDEPNLIGWRHFGGHVWRYRLEPTEGGTRVVEEFDWTKAKSPLMLKVMRAPARNRRSMEATLERLAQRFAE